MWHDCAYLHLIFRKFDLPGTGRVKFDIVDKTFLRVDSISTRIEKVEVLIEEGKNIRRHAKRLRILEKTLDTTYSALKKTIIMMMKIQMMMMTEANPSEWCQHRGLFMAIGFFHFALYTFLM